MVRAEEQPLLQPDAEAVDNASKHTEVILGFEEGDSHNPLEWPRGYKMGVVSLLALMAFTV
jgi:hypothetical protein